MAAIQVPPRPYIAPWITTTYARPNTLPLTTDDISPI